MTSTFIAPAAQPSNRSSHSSYFLAAFLMISLFALPFLRRSVAFAQVPAESYTATVIPAEGYSGGSARVTIQIASYTSDAERAQLIEALKKSTPDDAVALLHSMSHGHINIEGQPGRDIPAAFSRKSSDGRVLTLLLEHILTPYEQNKGIKATDFPFTIVRMKFDALGQPVSGEVIPAAKISVTKDGLFDVQTESRNSP